MIQSVTTGLRKRAALVLFAALTSGIIHAQQCFTNSLDISTGYSGTTTTSITTAGNAAPGWTVSAMTPAMAAAVTPVYSAPVPAMVVNKFPGWGNLPNSVQWVSYTQNMASNGFTTPAASNNPSNANNYIIDFSRSFRTCGGKINFSIDILADNWVYQVLVDGSPVAYPAQVTNGANYTNALSITPFSQTLSAGIHTLTIRIGAYVDPVITTNNFTGMSARVQLSAATPVLVFGDASCKDVACSGCSDECYWKVQGNNIMNGNNIFGTLTPNAIRIQSSATDRGIITSSGNLGWNTTTPTALLHVNCSGFNPDEGFTSSDVRFERLEPGKGNILVIDKQGYVYDSRIDLDALAKTNGLINTLQEEVAALKNEMAALRKKMDMPAPPAGSDNELYQNTPNPFNGETRIGYRITEMNQSGFILVFDMNGKEVLRRQLNEKGTGSILVKGSDLVPGTYLYTLYVDGQEIASRRMVITR
ncbi:T9SS type A sorting domain-containing protein [Taibaiella chishuiensis]|uniref:Putative secreted protein (Por secretion system target) n=1 Tax=Taibaiella chishuiensis TaxID=1434707 RepID=A0A2P8D8L6_9BACT|nr:T9SS type A sorting domain-containing protein [Taibaiella chishuiensis]PSK93542.1 putative secreted protein (Por secretion system target) [Taibaiella chishuiensis]